MLNAELCLNHTMAAIITLLHSSAEKICDTSFERRNNPCDMFYSNSLLSEQLI